MGKKARPSVEAELRHFTSQNFVQPSECRNLDQIRFYITELCAKIQDLERAGQYVPTWVYKLLSQYNARQNALILLDFKSNYR